MSTPPQGRDDDARLEAAFNRIARAQRRPPRGAVAVASLRRGGSLPEAVEEARLGAGIRQALEVARPLDPASAMESMAGALEIHHARLDSARATASYALVLCVATVVVSVLVAGAALPSLGVVVGAYDETRHSSSFLGLASAVVGLSLLLLLGLVWAVRSSEPRFPLGEARLGLLRALTLSVAARLSTQVALPEALLAAASLTGARAARAAAGDAARVLSSPGEALGASPLLFGELGTPVFFSAASAGAGAAALHALADLQEATLEAEWPAALRRAELWALLLAAAGLCAAGSTFLLAYGRIILGEG